MPSSEPPRTEPSSTAVHHRRRGGVWHGGGLASSRAYDVRNRWWQPVSRRTQLKVRRRTWVVSEPILLGSLLAMVASEAERTTVLWNPARFPYGAGYLPSASGQAGVRFSPNRAPFFCATADWDLSSCRIFRRGPAVAIFE